MFGEPWGLLHKVISWLPREAVEEVHRIQAVRTHSHQAQTALRVQEVEELAVQPDLVVVEDRFRMEEAEELASSVVVSQEPSAVEEE